MSNNKKNKMSNLKNAIEVSDDKTKLIGHFLIDFYETMKMLEKDSQKGGKQATCIIMAINDLKEIINNESAKNL